MIDMKKRAPTMAQDRANSAKIQAIRIAAGNEGTHCPTCGRPNERPYRRILGNAVVEGCIDAAHTKQIDYLSVEWHNRDIARQMRRDTLDRLSNVLRVF